MLNKSFVRLLHNEQEMLAFGEKLGKALQDGIIIYLRGSLGVGKTTLTRGMLRGLGYEDKVKSPTYTLVETYHVRGRTIHHFDLYRLSQPEELDDIGIHDYFTPKSICLVEWPENGHNRLPPADLECVINIEDHTRVMRLLVHTDQAEQLLKACHIP